MQVIILINNTFGILFFLATFGCGVVVVAVVISLVGYRWKRRCDAVGCGATHIVDKVGKILGRLKLNLAVVCSFHAVVLARISHCSFLSFVRGQSQAQHRIIRVITPENAAGACLLVLTRHGGLTMALFSAYR